MRVVIDTNVFLSGIHWIGSSHKVLRAWVIGMFTLVSSHTINAELFAQLRDFKIQMGREEILWWENLIMGKSEIILPKRKFDVVKDDPDDNKFIEAAVEGNCDYIVSNDKKHLLKLKEFRGIRIIPPDEFLKVIE